MFGGIVNGLKRLVGVHWMLGVLKDAAEGAYGEKPKAIYWAFHRWAIPLTAVLATSDYLLRYLAGNGMCASCGGYDAWLAFAWQQVLLPAGLAVEAHAALPPQRDAKYLPADEPTAAPKVPPAA